MRSQRALSLAPADPPATAVAAVIARVPQPARAQMLALRDLIYAAAGEAVGALPLTETLKWGQPAYIPPKSAGTTVRLNWSEAAPEVCQMLVHCQTDLIRRYRDLFPDEFDYTGNRAVLVPATGPFSEAAVQQMAAMALRYHRDKRRRP